MAVHYYTQGTKFRFPKRRRTSAWIRCVAAAEERKIGPISIVFCSEEELHSINRQFLEHDYPTDIITFDYSEPDQAMISGDLMIGVDTVKDNAKQFGATFEDELDRVIIHGILHLCGYGDKTRKEEKKMRELEDKYLNIR